MKISGAHAVIECLRQEGVEVVFGYPGGKVLTLYDALYKEKFPHVLTRHEQGAAHAADGYARVTGKVGVCIATSGPGATNLVTGIATAYMDSIPMVAITGQVDLELIGRDSFQEADIKGITTPITKHNYMVKRAEDLPVVFKEAFHIARSGRPGPVLIDIAKDIFAHVFEFHYPEDVRLRGYQPIFAGDEESINLVLEEIKMAKKPLIFIGGGVSLSATETELRHLAEITGFPVISSLMGLGCADSTKEQYLGMVGMHGTYAAHMSTTECDLLLGIGVRFDDRVISTLTGFAPKAKIVHFDIDPAEINKNVRVDLKVIGDLRWSLALLCDKASSLDRQALHEQTREWNRLVRIWKQENPLTYGVRENTIMPQAVVETVSRLTQGEAIIVTDVGQHQMWVAQYYQFTKNRTFLTSGGLGTMGYGLPAAVGAKVGAPDTPVILFSGDGGFMMNCQELATAASLQLPVKILVMNNETLGMVAQWQRQFYGERYSHTCLRGSTDYVKLAEAMGVKGFRATRPEELEEVLKKAFEYSGPALIDISIPSDEDVFPIVPYGKCLDEMIMGG